MTVPPPDANAAPRVCLIVVAYNSAAVIGDLLHSLREDEPAGYVRDVVVVDNASSDETVRVVEKEFPAALVIRNARNVGFGAANNIGAATEPGRRADYLAFVNPDVVVTRGWLTPLLEALQQRPELASVQPLILEGANGNRINSGGNRLHYLGYGSVGEYGQAAPPASGVVRECAYSSGCACVFRAADFRAVGGFDERFFLYVEDQDLGWRLRLAGRRHAAVWDSVVRHHYEFDKSPQKFFYLERNRWVFMLAHFSWRTLLLFGPAALLTELASWAFFILSGRARWKIRAEIDFLRPANLRWVWAKRHASQLTRRRSDRDLLDQLDARLDFAVLHSRAVRYVLNPFLALYWKTVRWLL